MKHNIYIFSLLIVFLFSCKDTTYKPEELTKLSHSEFIEKVRKGELPDESTLVFKNENGEVLSLDSIKNMQNSDEWFADSYVDKEGEIKELVIRKATEEDIELRKRTTKVQEYQAPIELIDIDCEQKQELLQRVYESDQHMRTDGGTIDSEIDRQNLTTVISLIEKCGMPTLEEVDDVQMSAIWVVFQHGDNDSRKKYLPLLEESAKNGDLKPTQIAMMKDRTMMMDGEPQVYGTQVSKNGEEWVLYELSNPETVNKRREEMGFEPIQEYLKRWDIEFNIEQVE